MKTESQPEAGFAGIDLIAATTCIACTVGATLVVLAKLACL